MIQRKGPPIRRNVLQKREAAKAYGSPVRSMRWKQLTWDQLHELESLHKYKAKTNRIAEVSVNFGLAFLHSLSVPLQERILGLKGKKPLTFQEQQKLREEIRSRLGSLAGEYRLNDRITVWLPHRVKQLLVEEAEKAGTTISGLGRQRIILTKEAE